MPSLDIETITLARGSHKNMADGLCVMEAVSFVAGEPWSDSPACASPVLANFLRQFNDSVDDETRQRLKPLIPKIVGTNTGPADEQIRGLMAVDWLVREYLPTWLELGAVAEYSTALRASPEITSWDQLVELTPLLIKAREASAKRADAARAAAWDAAWDAARAAAWDAARAAAWDALKPTVSKLQTSAIALAERMASVGKKS